MLSETGISAVFYVSGVLAERHPDLMQEIVRRGHAIAAHAWSQHIIPAYQTREQELSDLKRCIATLEATSGMRPKGWISPRATPSLDTPALLAKEQIAWFVDVFDRDLPYTLQTEAGAITAIPFTMEVNDFPLLVRYGQEPEAFVRMLKSMLDGWSEIGSPFACLDITAHAHVFGRPAGAMAFKSALRLAQQSPLAWMTHHAEIAELHQKAGV